MILALGIWNSDKRLEGQRKIFPDWRGSNERFVNNAALACREPGQLFGTTEEESGSTSHIADFAFLWPTLAGAFFAHVEFALCGARVPDRNEEQGTGFPVATRNNPHTRSYR